jgi:hypothetical protein
VEQVCVQPLLDSVCFTLAVAVAAHTWTELSEAFRLAEPEAAVTEQFFTAIKELTLLLELPILVVAAEVVQEILAVVVDILGALVVLVSLSFVTLLTALHLLLQQATLR